ncbi:MAG: DUF1552 domain-containing protein [Polyangiaceae bacterium]
MLKRRAFLGGASVLVSLPFLESLAPRVSKAQSAEPAKRIIFYFVPNGLDMATFRPSATGAGYPTPPMLAPLDAFKNDFSVITGLENPTGKPDDLGDHASGTASFITCAHAFKSETELSLGISADQVAANAIGKLTRLPSLQLGMAGGNTAGDCDSGYSCAYARNISWSTPTTPLPKIIDPAKAFDQIFAGLTPGVSDAEAAKRRLYDRSVLDSVLGEATSLRGGLGRTDQIKLDQYLDGVRELERRIDAGGANTSAACSAPTRPAATSDFLTKLKLMNDLMALAIQCDATRVISFMFGNALSNQTFPHLGITRGHHDISHHGSDPANIALLAQIGLFEVEQLAYLMQKLKSIEEANGTTALTNTTIYWSSDISDGQRHNHDDIPVILAGYGGGALKPGKHVAYTRNAHQKMSNLLLNVLGTVGVTGVTLGDSSGALSDV